MIKYVTEMLFRVVFFYELAYAAHNKIKGELKNKQDPLQLSKHQNAPFFARFHGNDLPSLALSTRAIILVICTILSLI